MKYPFVKIFYCFFIVLEVSKNLKYYVDIENGNLMVNDVKDADEGTFEYRLTKEPYPVKTDKIKVLIQGEYRSFHGRKA